MKILALGCLHGKVPKNLKAILKKEKPDLILGCGDWGGTKLRKPLPYYEHKAIKKYGTRFKLWPRKVRAWFIKVERHSVERGRKILKRIGHIGVPLYFVHGNWDGFQSGGETPNARDFFYRNTKNSFFVHNKVKRFGDLKILGYGGYRVTSMKEYLYKDLPNQIVTLKEISRYKRKMKKQMGRLFKKAKGGKVIFITHDPPHKTLDYLAAAKKFYGEKISREMIEKYKPLLCLCAHFHEHQGAAKIGKTLVVNSGFGQKGQMALIELNGKVKVGFVK